MEILLIYLLLGLFVGILAGLFGVGGGLVIVPILVLIFQDQAMSPSVVMHMAIGTSLATIMVTSLSSVRAHHRRGAVHWSVVWRLTAGIMLGALLGALIVDRMPNDSLRLFFGVFELLVAAQMALSLSPGPHRQLPKWKGMNLTGLVIGLVSAIIGIGGGTLTVPFLVWCNIAMREAVATSAACGFPIALAGTVGFILVGWGEAGLPYGSTGFVYWPAFLGIAAASVLFAPLGARLAHTLPAATLKRYFAIFLALLGVRMLMLG